MVVLLSHYFGTHCQIQACSKLGKKSSCSSWKAKQGVAGFQSALHCKAEHICLVSGWAEKNKLLPSLWLNASTAMTEARKNASISSWITSVLLERSLYNWSMTMSFGLTIFTFSKMIGSSFLSDTVSLLLFHLSSFSFCKEKTHWHENQNSCHHMKRKFIQSFTRCHYWSKKPRRYS